MNSNIKYFYLTSFVQVEHLQVSMINISQMEQHWETVGYESRKSGRDFGVWMPTEDFRKNPTRFLSNRYLNIGLYPHFLWLFKHVLPEIRNQLQFQDHLKQHVRAWKAELLEDIKKKVIFVGVHCRRTDFEYHLQTKNGGATLVDQRFFDTAFQIYRDRYNNDDQQVVFLAVSDDNQWLKVG